MGWLFSPLHAARLDTVTLLRVGVSNKGEVVVVCSVGPDLS